MKGTPAWMTKRSFEMAGAVAEDLHVRLLPSFDSYVIGYRPRDSLVSSAAAGLVFRQQGWISPVLLVDGRVAGVWELGSGERKEEIRVTPFERLTSSERGELQAEVRRMEDYFSSDLKTAFGPRFARPSSPGSKRPVGEARRDGKRHSHGRGE